MKRRPAPPNPPRASAQRGSFLLEALISVLIVALGLLGLIGLQARAIQNVDDAQYRAEAAYLANALLGQMWVHDPKTAQLKADFDDTARRPQLHRVQGLGRRSGFPGPTSPAMLPR